MQRDSPGVAAPVCLTLALPVAQQSSFRVMSLPFKTFPGLIFRSQAGNPGIVCPDLLPYWPCSFSAPHSLSAHLCVPHPTLRENTERSGSLPRVTRLGGTVTVILSPMSCSLCPLPHQSALLAARVYCVRASCCPRAPGGGPGEPHSCSHHMPTGSLTSLRPSHLPTLCGSCPVNCRTPQPILEKLPLGSLNTSPCIPWRPPGLQLLY